MANLQQSDGTNESEAATTNDSTQGALDDTGRLPLSVAVSDPPRTAATDLRQIEAELASWEDITQASIPYDVDACLQGMGSIWRRLKGRRAEKPRLLRERLMQLTHTLYHDKMLSYGRLQEACGFSQSHICQQFQRLGLPARHCSEKTPDAGEHHRDYSVAHDALDDLTVASVAYLLGFLWADGRVLLRNDGSPEGVRVVLNPRDEDMLRVIRDLLGSDAPIRIIRSSRHSNGRRYPALSLTIYSCRIASRLVHLGYAARHAGQANVAPPALPKDVEVHFWRGVCDGDGHIKRDKRCVFPLSGWELGICGSEALVAAFRAFVHRTVGVETRVIRNGRSVVNYRVYVTGVRTPILAETLYPAGCVGMARKYAIARDLTRARKDALAGGVREAQTVDRLIYTNTAAAPPTVHTVLHKYLRPAMAAESNATDEPA